jgi:hypothetical protein
MNYENSWQFFFNPSDRVMALPCWKKPRLYVVSKNCTQRWDDSSFYPAFKLRAKCFKLAIRFLAMFGCFSVRRPVLHGEFSREGCRLVVLRGAEGPAQKLIARVVDETTAKTVAYIKYAETAVARSKVDAEYRILKALADQDAAIAPSIKKYGFFVNGVALEIAAVDGKMLEARLPASVDDESCPWHYFRFHRKLSVATLAGQLLAIKEYLNQLRVSDELFEIDRHPAILRIRKQISEISDQRSGVAPDFRPLTSDFLDTLLAPLCTQKWPVVVQHGDFAPWNVLRTSEVGCQRSENSHTHTPIHPDSTTSLVAIDWEEGVLEGFPYFDFIYFVLQTGCLIHGWQAKAVFDYLIPRRAGEGLSMRQITALVGLCALDAYFRFGEEQGNPRLQEFRKQVFSHASQ